MRNSPTVQAMGWDPENGCSPAQVLTSYRTYVFSKLPSQVPTLMKKICNGLGQKNTVSDNVHQAIRDVVGDMEVRVGRRMMRAISRMLSSFLVRIMIAKALQSRMIDKQWLAAAKDIAHVETLHACMYSFKVCKAFGVIFVGRDFAIEVDQRQMCPTYHFQPKFLCLHLHLFDTW